MQSVLIYTTTQTNKIQLLKKKINNKNKLNKYQKYRQREYKKRKEGENMRLNSKENKIESGMEGLQIGDQVQGVMMDQSSEKTKNRRGWRHNYKCGMNEAGSPEGKQHWREMRRQRMAMRQAMMDGGAWGGFSMHDQGPHGKMHPTIMHGYPHGPLHGRHSQKQFSPMMFVGPQSNQFEGDFDPTTRGRRPFHPGMMAMMPMFAGMGCHGMKKGKKSDCENNTDSAADSKPKEQSQRRRKWRKGNLSEGMPPLMMAPWMFRGQRFHKCMDKDSCCQNESQDSTEKQTKKKPINDSESGIDEVRSNEYEGEKFGPKQQMRIMKRIMAMNGGYPPMMAMYHGGMFPPGMMHRFMQRKRCQHKKKGDKPESGDSPSSGIEIEITREDNLKDDIDENVATENVAESSEPCEMLGASSNANDGDTVKEDDNKNDKEHKKCQGHRHRHRQQMRAMIMNGGFPPMWSMMSHRGFHNQCPHKGRKGKSPKAEDYEQSGEEKTMTS